MAPVPVPEPPADASTCDVTPPRVPPRRVAVVGAGLAGWRSCLALRERGYTGPLVLHGAEAHEPYDRPPLSKAVLRGTSEHSRLDADWAALEVELRLGAPVEELSQVQHEEGAVVLAVGARALRLPGAHALTLRTLDDARVLRSRLRPGARVVVVGAGWIGAEVATAAALAGCRTTVLERAEAPLSTALPAAVARLTLPWWDDAGIDLRLGAQVVAVEPDAVHLAQGPALAADVVVAAVGVRPDTGWLSGSGVTLADDGAVCVGAGMRTGVPGVWAVGDCAAWESARYGARVRLEHWDSALHSPDVVAANMLGGDEVHDPVPYVWSEQLGHMLQYVGRHEGVPGTVDLVHRRAADGTWAVFWLDRPSTGASGRRIVAALTADRPRDLVQARRLAERGTLVDPRALADPAVAVKDART